MSFPVVALVGDLKAFEIMLGKVLCEIISRAVSEAVDKVVKEGAREYCVT